MKNRPQPVYPDRRLKRVMIPEKIYSKVPIGLNMTCFVGLEARIVECYFDRSQLRWAVILHHLAFKEIPEGEVIPEAILDVELGGMPGAIPLTSLERTNLSRKA